MIKLILALLHENDAYNFSEDIEVAKGKYKIPKTLSENFRQIKRDIKFKKNNGK